MSHPLASHPFSRKVNDRNDKEDLGLANPPLVAQSVPTLGGIPLKYISLMTLAVQNSTLTIVMHYSRISTSPSQAYSAATAVLVNEIIKGAISLFIAFTSLESGQALYGSGNGNCMPRLRKLWRDVFSSDCWKLSIPAMLYVVQNNLQYVAATNLDAATFQVTYQMKILTTAAFSVLLLRKKLSPSQWTALLLLALGVGIVQIQTGVHNGTVGQTITHSKNALTGFMAVTAACFTSGLAGVYFEMVLKNSQANLWIRNVQLSLFSLLPALIPIILSYNDQSEKGLSSFFGLLFQNFGVWAWATVAVQVLGGLLTAMVIKYSDNILKGFATSLSIVISFLASMALFNFKMTFTFVLGSTVVVGATWLYNSQPKRPIFLPLWFSKDSMPVTRSRSRKGEKRIPEAFRPPSPAYSFGGPTAVSSTTSLSSITSTLSDSEKTKTLHSRQ